ncbi:MAG: type II secretion system protein [Deltaproteobacteria bacterium]|nr:type II secretion system protein [Deltaproteobacteria bacterium]
MERRGFTLVELMIVVAIIGILSALAIPNFFAMQNRARRAEVPVNVDGIRTAEIAYEAANDIFMELSEAPGGAMDKRVRAWTWPPDYEAIGFSPSGQVRGNYSAELYEIFDFTVRGQCDVDTDGRAAEYTATKSIRATMLTPQDVY